MRSETRFDDSFGLSLSLCRRLDLGCSVAIYPPETFQRGILCCLDAWEAPCFSKPRAMEHGTKEQDKTAVVFENSLSVKILRIYCRPLFIVWRTYTRRLLFRLVCLALFRDLQEHCVDLLTPNHKPSLVIWNAGLCTRWGSRSIGSSVLYSFSITLPAILQHSCFRWSDRYSHFLLAILPIPHLSLQAASKMVRFHNSCKRFDVGSGPEDQVPKL